jgi:hypothetical protein
MDCRVKPGNDDVRKIREAERRQSHGRQSRTKRVRSRHGEGGYIGDQCQQGCGDRIPDNRILAILRNLAPGR